MTQKPTLIIFAGANGSGKTTAARHLLPREHILEFVNADEIARGLSPLNPSGQAVRAGRLVLERMENLIESKESFAVETTLSGQGLARYLKLAKAAGYTIKMNFLYTDDIRINIKRIRERVKQGGHGVPPVDVRRRYGRGLHNFYKTYLHLCDEVGVYNTTQTSLSHVMLIFPGQGYVVYDEAAFQSFSDKIRESV